MGFNLEVSVLPSTLANILIASFSPIATFLTKPSLTCAVHSPTEYPFPILLLVCYLLHLPIAHNQSCLVASFERPNIVRLSLLRFLFE